MPCHFDVTLDFHVRVLGFKERRRMVAEGHPPPRQVAYSDANDARPTIGSFAAGGSLGAEISGPDGLPIELRQW